MSGPLPGVPVDDCGAGDGVNCSEVLAAVWTYLDGETTEAERDHLRGHLEECVACLRHYDLEHDVKRLVARCCGNDRAPEELRTRVLAVLRTAQADGVTVTTTTVAVTRTLG
jgi:mycothiol system anti-sigma-R factor